MEKRNTVQKKLVLDAVEHLADHPTAEQVYQEVISEHPSVSKATVYRNLSGLAQDGTIRHIPIPGGADRFDHNVTCEHNHITCKECGWFGDAPVVDSDILDATVSAETGFSNVTHEIIYRGICPTCRKKQS